MGVQGLWQLLTPTGKPVTLESLDGKILAVDVSIWLNQAVKGMRDRQGNTVANAHLVTLFHRICKLLFYRIKPVFVFDGGVPALKRQTLAARKLKKAEAAVISEKTARKMLQNMMKQHALNSILSAGPSNESAPTTYSQPVMPVMPVPSASGKKDDIFTLPPLPEVEKPEGTYSDDEDEADEETYIDPQAFLHGQDLESYDLESPDFLALPAEVRHEILVDLKEARKNKHFANWDAMPQETGDFAKFQLRRLMKRSLIGQKIEDVRKEINSQIAGDLPSTLTHGRQASQVTSRKLASEDSAHYILIKGIRSQAEDTDTYIQEMEQKPNMMSVFDASQTSADIEFERLSRAAGYVKQESDATKMPVEEEKVKGKEEDEDEDDILAFLRRKEEKRKMMFAQQLKQFREEQKQKEVMLSSESEDEVDQDNKQRPIVMENDVSDSELAQISTEGLDCVAEKPVDYDVAGGFFVDSDDEKQQTLVKNSNRKAQKMDDDVKEVAGRSEVYESFQDSVAVESDNEVTETDRQASHTSSLKRKLETEEKEKSSEPKQMKLTPQQRRAAILEELKAKKAKLAEAAAENSGDMMPEKTVTDENKPVESQKQETFSVQNSEASVKHIDEEVMSVSPQLPKENPEEMEEKANSFSAPALEEKQKSDEETRTSTPPCLEENSPKTTQTTSSPQPPKQIAKKTDVKKNILAELKAKLQEEKAKLAIQAEENHALSKMATSSALIHRELEAVGNHSVERCVTENVEESNAIVIDEETGEFNTKKSGRSAIEIEVDLKKSAEQEDELFPASVFESHQHDTGTALGTIENQERRTIEESTACNTVESHGEDTTENTAEVIEEEEKGPTETDPQEKTLAAELDGMSQADLHKLQADLGKETRSMQKERDRQDRIASTITDQMYTEAQELLQLFGIPYIVSPMEAEAQCAFLDHVGLTDGSITDDSDIWLFGGQRVYKNFFNQSRHVEFYTADTIKHQLMIGRDDLINIGVLCGSDYTDGIQGLGPVGAMELMSDFPGNGIQQLRTFKAWWDYAQKHPRLPQESKVRTKLRQLFVKDGFPSEAVVVAYMEPEVDHSTEKFSWGCPDLDVLRSFACERFGWLQSKADESLVPMMKQLNVKNTQASIKKFFTQSLGEAAPMKSKRLQRTLDARKAKDQGQGDSLQGQGQQDQGQGRSKKPKVTVTAKIKQMAQKNSGGGFVSQPNRRKAVDKVDLSESSSEDSDLELLKAVNQIEDKVEVSAAKETVTRQNSNRQTKVNSAAKKTVGKGKGKGKGRGKGRGKLMARTKQVHREVKLSESGTDSD